MLYCITPLVFLLNSNSFSSLCFYNYISIFDTLFNIIVIVYISNARLNGNSFANKLCPQRLYQPKYCTHQSTTIIGNEMQNLYIMRKPSFEAFELSKMSFTVFTTWSGCFCHCIICIPITLYLIYGMVIFAYAYNHFFTIK